MKAKVIRKKNKEVVNVDEVIESAETVEGVDQDSNSSDSDIFSGGEEVISTVDVSLESLKKRTEKKQEVIIEFPDDLKDIDIRGHIKDLKNNVDKNLFELAKVLYYVKIKEEFITWGFVSFDEYIKSEFDFKERSSYNYIQWYEWAIKHDPKVLEKIKSIGYTKGLELAKADVSPSTVEKYIDIAEKSSASELRDIIKQEKTIEKESKPKKENDKAPVDVDVQHKVVMSFYTEQHEVVLKALKIASEIGKTEVKSQAMYLICLSYLSDCLLQEDPDKNLEAILQKFESLAKIKLVAIDSVTNDVIYGKELLDA